MWLSPSTFDISTVSISSKIARPIKQSVCCVPRSNTCEYCYTCIAGLEDLSRGFAMAPLDQQSPSFSPHLLATYLDSRERNWAWIFPYLDHQSPNSPQRDLKHTKLASCRPVSIPWFALNYLRLGRKSPLVHQHRIIEACFAPEMHGRRRAVVHSSYLCLIYVSICSIPVCMQRLEITSWNDIGHPAEVLWVLIPRR